MKQYKSSSAVPCKQQKSPADDVDCHCCRLMLMVVRAIFLTRCVQLQHLHTSRELFAAAVIAAACNVLSTKQSVRCSHAARVEAMLEHHNEMCMPVDTTWR